MYFQVALNLVLVLVVILIYFAITWKIRKYKIGKGQLMDVIAMLPVGPKEKIILIKVDDQRLLIGVTPHNISMLSSMESDVISSEFTDIISDKLRDRKIGSEV